MSFVIKRNKIQASMYVYLIEHLYFTDENKYDISLSASMGNIKTGSKEKFLCK
jgi:hypothetical protein